MVRDRIPFTIYLIQSAAGSDQFLTGMAGRGQSPGCYKTMSLFNNRDPKQTLTTNFDSAKGNGESEAQVQPDTRMVSTEPSKLIIRIRSGLKLIFYFKPGLEEGQPIGGFCRQNERFNRHHRTAGSDQPLRVTRGICF
jgi:hypothetical protein